MDLDVQSRALDQHYELSQERAYQAVLFDRVRCRRRLRRPLRQLLAYGPSVRYVALDLLRWELDGSELFGSSSGNPSRNAVRPAARLRFEPKRHRNVL